MSHTKAADATWRGIPGHYYDWTKTLQPESHYIHDYSKTLTMKLAMAVPDLRGGSRVFCTFEQALRYVEETDRLTRGIPKIIYLVGWQYNGHDDKYPAWDEVNVHLKRPQDATARDSYLWLVDEARKHNTTISVHANMTDAYDDSPYWDLYLEHDAIARNEDGTWKQIGVYNDRAAYHICPKMEWESGLAVHRIEKLISLLELDKVGTVHLDAYFPRFNAYYDISETEESSYMRRTIRYFRQCGIDVTSENLTHLRDDPFIGLQAWSWVFDVADEKRMIGMPAPLVSGGVIRDYTVPGIPFRHDLAFLFGASMHGEDVYLDSELQKPRDQWHDLFLEKFCLNALHGQYLNRLDRIRIEGEGDGRVMHFSGGHEVRLSDRSVRKGGRLLREGDDLLLPAQWRDGRELIAYSKLGYTAKTWSLPAEWSGVEAVDLRRIMADGLKEMWLRLPVEGGVLELSLEPGAAVSIIPSVK
ncbi:endo-alpha-N-acetylgalactosaminidase family protein [Paenibacillus sp. LHD-117]|uniref:endo-alpha-N-acetylgalactosaminidase family protein n=1 Tax=Paenibacillus sp. LHD-117 TaxID=3071412 RepID=UPI0027E03DFA|nr:endo-alpha-N-acetylgalactosaminidase family protein [Paenibacillus sp. LHD-117]MDQ6420553.1 endo-alpha-N-acetylgalactosaminidase family protein [Paenibacillus sp. LHD-117]